MELVSVCRVCYHADSIICSMQSAAVDSFEEDIELTLYLAVSADYIRRLQ